MYQTDRRFDRVLSIFDEQGDIPLTPSFVAYELDVTSRSAEQVLDEMVKHSLLDLDFDENGQLYYSLGADGHARLRGAASATDWAQPGGADGAVGHAPAAAPPFQPSRRPAPAAVAPDGCDGTVGHPGEAGGYGFAAPDDRSGADGSAHLPQRWTPPYDGPSATPAPPGAAPHHPRHHDPGAPHQQPWQSPRDTRMARYEHRDLIRHRQADPMIAGLLSVLIVGTGQIYNRQVGKGLVMFVACWVLWLTFGMGWIINIWAIVDAYNVANRNRRNADRELEPT